MKEPQNIQWKRIAVEAAAIVGSILLAFWIDASWQNRQDVEQGRRLADALVAELTENDSMLAVMISDSRDASALSRKLLDVMASTGNEQGANQLRDLGTVFTMWTWLPDIDVYQQAVASGQLLLIDDSNLRFELAGYYSSLSSVRGVVENIRTQYHIALEPFLVANTIYTDIAYSGWLKDLPVPPFSTDIDSLSTNPELWSLIALRLEHDLSLTYNLEQAREAGDELRKSLLVYLN